MINIGQKGDSENAPQNTMSSFKSALDNGADGFETDLRLTSDGTIVLREKEELSEASNCSGSVGSYNFEELRQCDAGSWFSSEFKGEKIPAFEEAVQFASSNGMFILMELKNEGLGEKIAPIIKSYNMFTRVVALCSTETQIEDISKHLNITVKLKLGEMPDDVSDEYFVEWKSKGVRAFSLQSTKKPIPAKFLRLAHKNKMPVFTSINDIDLLQELDKIGVDGIIGKDVPKISDLLQDNQKKMFSEYSSHSFSSKFDYSRTTPLLFGKSGDSEKYPENTILAFSHSINNGVDGITIDVRKTKDNVYVAFRDETLERTTNCTGKISEISFIQLQNCDAGKGETVPKLGDVISLANENEVAIVLNIKEDGFSKDIISLISSIGNMHTRTTVSCETVDQIKEFSEESSIVTKELVITEFPTFGDNYFKEIASIGVSSIHLKKGMKLNSDFIRNIRIRTIMVSGEGDSNEEFFEIMKDGLDVIIGPETSQLIDFVENIRKKAFK